MKDSDGEGPLFLLTERSYEDGRTRLLEFECGYSRVVARKKNRKNPWEYEKELYKQRNEAGRMFRWIGTR
jgi:hypothetical protein